LEINPDIIISLMPAEPFDRTVFPLLPILPQILFSASPAFGKPKLRPQIRR
jgi:hypothetical protein